MLKIYVKSSSNSCSKIHTLNFQVSCKHNCLFDTPYYIWNFILQCTKSRMNWMLSYLESIFVYSKDTIPKCTFSVPKWFWFIILCNKSEFYWTQMYITMWGMLLQQYSTLIEFMEIIYAPLKWQSKVSNCYKSIIHNATRWIGNLFRPQRLSLN